MLSQFFIEAGGIVVPQQHGAEHHKLSCNHSRVRICGVAIVKDLNIEDKTRSISPASLATENVAAAKSRLMKPRTPALVGRMLLNPMFSIA